MPGLRFTGCFASPRGQIEEEKSGLDSGVYKSWEI